MANSQWVKKQRIFCERVNDEVFLLEERIYPDDLIPEPGAANYHVRKQRCSHWLDCNLEGQPCCWSGINPNYDPFEEQRHAKSDRDS